MGGNKQANKNNDMIDTNIDQTKQAGTTGQTKIQDQENNTQTNMNRDDSATQASIGKMAGRDYSTNYVPNQSGSNSAFQQFGQTGGIDESKLGGGNATFNDQMNNQDIANNYRANGTYADFAKTGGMSDKDISNVRGRISSQVPAYYDAMKQQSAQANAAAGGYNPGAAAAMAARNARGQAGASADAVRSGEIDLRNTINQGKMFGATGMTNAEGAYQGMRQGAATNLDADQARTQGMVQQGKMFGATGLQGNEQFAGSMGYGQANANANRQFGQDQAVLGANTGQFQSDRDYMGGMIGAGQNQQAIQQSGQQGSVGQRIQNNPRRDYTGQIIGSAGGILGGIAAF